MSQLSVLFFFLAYVFFGCAIWLMVCAFDEERGLGKRIGLGFLGLTLFYGAIECIAMLFS